MEFHKPVLFFDGYCGLCNRWVDWLVRLDKNQKVFIASLQGETASRLLPGKRPENPDSLVLYENSRLFYKSEALFRLAGIVRGPLIPLLLFCRLPGRLTDGFYDLVAGNRYRFMARRPTCRIPEEDEKEHFLRETPTS